MSSKFSPKKKENEAYKKSDIDFFKMSSLFFIVCALLIFILRISGTISLRQSTGGNLAYELYKLFRSPVYIAVAALLLAASIVWFLLMRIKKKDESLRLFSSTNALCFMLYVAFFSLYFGRRTVNNQTDCMLLLAITIALALIYYISKIYHADFLFFSVENAILAILLYRYVYIYTVGGIIGKILLIISVLLLSFVFIKVSKRKNTSRLSKGKKKQYKPLSIPFFVTLLIWAVFMFIKLPDPLAAPIITLGTMLTVFLIQYIIFAIIYTIRLIRE